MSDPQGTGPSLADLTPTLVNRLREGDPTAGRLLADIYRNPLLRFCFRYLKNQEEAEDVVQEVFLRVLKHKAQPANFRAWIYRIARNCSLDVIRAGGRRRDDGELPPASRVDAELTGCLTRLVRREQQAELKRALAQLSEDHREVLHLRYTEGLSRQETAEVLGLPETLVKSRLYEAIVKLRAHDSIVDPG
jgi:RNA polymerase sigma-70 factor (ECF subfamily)